MALNMAEYFETFYDATTALEESGIKYVVGGGIAVWAYGRRRETKDIDVFCRKKDAEAILSVLRSKGFRTEHSDDRWLYKAFRGDAMVDVIFENTRGKGTDDLMLDNARFAPINSHRFRIMSPEDLIYIKIISLIENSPHWEDAFSIVINNYEKIDWQYLVDRSNNEARIMLSFLLYVDAALDKKVIPESIFRSLADICGLT